MQLTANEELELKYMQALGYKWIARDGDRKSRVFAWQIKPNRGEIEWIHDESEVRWLHVGEYDFLKWEDGPMEIDKLLMKNGWDIPLVEPKDDGPRLTSSGNNPRPPRN